MDFLLEEDGIRKKSKKSMLQIIFIEYIIYFNKLNLRWISMGENNSKPEKSYDLVETIKNNKNVIDILKKKIFYLDKKVLQEVKNAKIKLKSGDKKNALICLKRKKIFEKQINNFTSQMFNLEQQIITLEGSVMNKKIIDTMNTTNNTMKHINKKVNINDISDLNDDINDHINNINEVNNLLSDPINNDFDDDDLLEELDILDEDDNDNNINIELPKVPETKIKIKIENDDDAIKELERMMS